MSWPFEIPAGGEFTHSADFRTIFGADEVLYVVEGRVALADPQTGVGGARRGGRGGVLRAGHLASRL